MPVVPPSVPGSNRQQQIAFYAGLLDSFANTHGYSDTYQGNLKSFQGMTWGNMYTDIANTNSKANPKQLADSVLSLETAQGLGKNLSSATGQLGSFLTAAEKATAQTDFNTTGVPNSVLNGAGGLLSGLAAIGDFFARLTEANTWLRVGEVTLGVILISIGIAKMTNAVPVATKIAKTVT